jgi:hypothetical protein
MTSHNKSSTKSAGYLSKHDRKSNGPPEGLTWVWLTFDMLESAAFRALSHPAHKVLFRITREHMAQGGVENGRLKVTARDFQADVHPRHITAAIAEVEALGFAKRTFKGRRSYGEDRGAPAQWRLTWLPVFEVNDASPATNEWKRFGDDLEAAKRAAEKACSQAKYRRCTPTVDAEKTAKRIQRWMQKARPTVDAETHPTVDAEEKNSARTEPVDDGDPVPATEKAVCACHGLGAIIPQNFDQQAQAPVATPTRRRLGGRPPNGDRAMTGAERAKAYRDRKTARSMAQHAS